jgi:hypothetical protein
MLDVRTPKGAGEVKTLLASAARNVTLHATGNGDAVRLPVAPAYAFVLDVSAAATAAGDTLDVFVQAMLDGTNWVDVVHFTQVLGDGGAKRYVSKIAPGAVVQAEFEVGAALAAAAVRHLAGDKWRVRWAIVDANASGGFTFGVTGIPM